MGRRKKTDPKPDKALPTWWEYEFVGGPKDGKKMRLCVPPALHIRLAFPEWSTYSFDRSTGTYHYEGSEPISAVGGVKAWTAGSYLADGWTPPGY